jgi:hypothetical protein
MATLDWSLARVDEVTFVELVVTSDIDERVEIESNLQPVWPPRRRGRPAAGWDETGVTGVVTADDPLVLGYASPAEPVDPPAELTDCQPVTAAESASGDGGRDDTPSPQLLVRALGAAEPPRDAIPVPETGETPDAMAVSTSTDDPGAEVQTRAETAASAPTGDATTHQPAPDATAAPDSWFEAVEHRLVEAERLAGGAGTATQRAGSDIPRDLHEQLAADRRRLEAVTERCQRLTTRLGEVEDRLDTPEQA